MSEFPPLSIQFSGRPRERFETHAMDLQPSIVRASPRLRVHSRAEAQRLPSYLQAQDRSVFDAQMIPTLYRVQEDRCEALAERGYTVADGTMQKQELLADSGVPTCESCGETVRALARSQTGSPVTCPTPTPHTVPKSWAPACGSRPCIGRRPPRWRESSPHRSKTTMAYDSPDVSSTDSNTPGNGIPRAETTVVPSGVTTGAGGTVSRRIMPERSESGHPQCETIRFSRTHTDSYPLPNGADHTLSLLRSPVKPGRGRDDVRALEPVGQVQESPFRGHPLLKPQGILILSEAVLDRPLTLLTERDDHVAGHATHPVGVDKLEAEQGRRLDPLRCRRVRTEGTPVAHTASSGVRSHNPSAEHRLCTDGGVPESFESLAATCESCCGDVEPRYLEDGECPGCVYGEPMTDGGVDGETVGALALPPTTNVHHASRTGGPRQKVHTDPTCRHLRSANRTRTRPVETVPDDWPVCRACLGISTPREPTGDMQATRKALQDTAPEELGLSPLGQRSAANGGEP